jgi:hypothetical protein
MVLCVAWYQINPHLCVVKGDEAIKALILAKTIIQTLLIKRP